MHFALLRTIAERNGLSGLSMGMVAIMRKQSASAQPRSVWIGHFRLAGQLVVGSNDRPALAGLDVMMIVRMLGGDIQTRSVMVRPPASSCAILSGLLVISRTLLTPSSPRIRQAGEIALVHLEAERMVRVDGIKA